MLLIEPGLMVQPSKQMDFKQSLLSFSIYLAHVADVLKAVEEIAGEGIPQYLNGSKDESASSWPTLNK